MRTSTGGSDDEYFDVDIVSDEETLEHDIIDGDSSDIDEGVTTTVGVSAGFMAPLQGVVVADELILALVSHSLHATTLLNFSWSSSLFSKTAKVVLTSNWFGPSLPALPCFFYSFLAQFSFDFETFPRNALIGPWAANDRRAENVGWGRILGGYSAVVNFLREIYA